MKVLSDEYQFIQDSVDIKDYTLRVKIRRVDRFLKPE